MALQRYRDPRNGSLWSLTADDAQKRGFVLAPERMQKVAKPFVLDFDEADAEEAPEYPKSVGSNKYELSNGKQVRGYGPARKAQQEIDAPADATAESDSDEAKPER